MGLSPTELCKRTSDDPADHALLDHLPEDLSARWSMDNSSPSTAPGTLSQTQILEATEALLRESGYDATTIRAIARRLGCAVGSIYRYFTDKQQLLMAVTQRYFEPVASRIECGYPLEKTMHHYCRAAREQPQLYRLMFWMAGSHVTGDQKCMPQIIERIITGWATQVQEPEQAWQIWALLHGNIMLGFDQATTDRTVARLAVGHMPLVAEIPPSAAPKAINGHDDFDLSRLLEPVDSPLTRLLR